MYVQKHNFFSRKLLIFCPVNCIHVWIFDFIDVPDIHHCQLTVQWPLTLQINVVRNLIVYLHSRQPHLSQPLDLLDKYQQLDLKVCSQELWLKNDLSNECRYFFCLLVKFLTKLYCMLNLSGIHSLWHKNNKDTQIYQL